MEYIKTFVEIFLKPIFQQQLQQKTSNKPSKKHDLSIYFLLLHIIFTLNTILIAFISLLNETKLLVTPKTVDLNEITKFLNAISILFALLACVVILIYELLFITASNFSIKTRLTFKCIIVSCFLISSKSHTYISISTVLKIYFIFSSNIQYNNNNIINNKS
jgi:hypothetical protein